MQRVKNLNNFEILNIQLINSIIQFHYSIPKHRNFDDCLEDYISETVVIPKTIASIGNPSRRELISPSPTKPKTAKLQ